MSENQVDNSKRRFLVAATGAAGAVAAAGVATPFVLTFMPSERAKAAGAPVEVDISKLEAGQKINVEWRGKPVWIVNRTKEQLDNLKKLDEKLTDPKSEMEMQPEYAKNEARSIKPEILIAVGICTHLGCSPTHRPDIGPADLGADWLGGFFCPCHGSKFDLAGRVFKGVPAPTNLEVPPYSYEGDKVLVIGVDQETA